MSTHRLASRRAAWRRLSRHSSTCCSSLSRHPSWVWARAQGTDAKLIDLVQRVAPLLALPLVLCAALSQFSAATADTEAGVGNLRVIGWAPLEGRRSYALVGVVAAILAATIGTAVIIVVASRAFAAYYALQCIVAVRTSERTSARLAYAALGLVMAVIAVLARPAG